MKMGTGTGWDCPDQGLSPSAPESVPILRLSSPQFVAGIHLAVLARGRKRWMPAYDCGHDGPPS